MERKNILFYGRVQGVGFRYRSYMKATHYNLSGWVRNLEDGSVEMEVQGESVVIEQMLAALQDEPFLMITEMRFTAKEVLDKEKSFRILN